MEQVKKFDQELKKQYSYSFVISHFVSMIFLVLGVILTPVDIEESSFPVSPFALILLFWGISLYLLPYLRITEDNLNHSSPEMTDVSSLLRWQPVQKREILAVRISYLNRLCLTLLLVCLAVSQLVGVLSHSWSFHNLTDPVITLLCIWLLESVSLYIRICQ